MNYRIEFNRKQNALHLEMMRKSMKKENTFGWETIADDVPEPLATVFSEVVGDLFGLYNEMPMKDRVTVNILKHEFSVFVTYLGKLQERGFVMVDIPKNNKGHVDFTLS